MAEPKINHSEVEAYAKKFAAAVCDKHFDGQDVITGQQILKLTPIKQVNFFILKSLFETWQDETRKLHSPYFNYKDDKVVKALLSFMNVLSQNIQIKREDFEPLATIATQESLYLMIAPFEYFWVDISKNVQSHLTQKNLSSKSKYLKANKHIFEAILEKVTPDGEGKIAKESVLNTLEVLISKGDISGESFSEALALFSEISPLEPDLLLERLEDDTGSDDDFSSFIDEEDLVSAVPGNTADEPEERDEERDTYSFEPTSEMETSSLEPEEEIESSTEETGNQIEQQESIEEEIIEDEQAADTAEEVEGEKEEEVVVSESEKVEDEQEEEVLADEDEIEEVELEDQQSEEPEEPKELPRLEDEEEFDNRDLLNKKFSKEQSTVHDHLKDKEKVTIADIHESGKKGSIQDSINLNQRYMFVNELFNNDTQMYNKAIDDIERCESFDDSVEVLIQRYAKKLDWNMNSPEVKELLKIIFKKFR